MLGPEPGRKRILAANPGLTGTDLYRQILVVRLGGDTMAAEAVLKLATDSYAKWPLDRALSFRDVVHYLAFTDCLAADDSVHWTSENLGNHVAKWIPGDL